MSENDVNLAALWVPVLAETSQLKGQLVKAGTEGGAAAAVAMREAFTKSGAFTDIGNQLNRQFMGLRLPTGLLSGFEGLFSRTKAAEVATQNLIRSHEVLTDTLRREEIAQARLNDLQASGAGGRSLLAATLAADVAHRNSATSKEADAQAEAKYQTALARSSGSLAAFSSVANGVGLAATVGLGAAMVETTKKAGDFQQSMIKLHAAAGMPTDQLATMSNGILEMAGKVGISADKLSEGAFTIAKYGYNAADGLKIMSAAAQGANAEQADFKETLNALALSMHNFNAKPEEAARVMSQMVTAVGESRGTLQEFAGSLSTVEPLAARLGLKLEDVWGVLAQGAKSGMSFDQTADQMVNAMRALSGAQGPARTTMQQFGISADDVSQKLSQRGLAGTMQYLSDSVLKKSSDGFHVNAGELRNAAQAQTNFNGMLEKMSPFAQQHAKALAANTEGSRAYTMAMRGANEEDKTQMEQARHLIDTLDGFSKRFANGKDAVETVTQALVEMTGTTSAASIALQTTGANAQATNDGIKAIATTYTEADGSVKGFHESQEGLNAKMRDAKAAFGAAAIEVGQAFVPVMIQVANVAKDVGDAMAKHPAILHGVVTAVEALSGAWLAVKGINFVSSVLAPATAAAGGLAVAEDAAAVSAGGLKTALLGLAGPVAAGLAVGPQLGHWVEKELNSPGMNWANDHIRNPVRNFFGADSIPDAHAAGGQITGSGPKGKDSVPAWLAPGEHVLTAAEVDAMGGQAGVYAFRKGLHRQGGGDIPGYDQGGAAPSVPIVQRPDGTWTSPNPAWAHLMQRESSGNPTVQNNTDSNAQHGDPSQGLFQFTTATWQRLGGGQFAPHPGQASPQQQAIMAAKLIQANPSGSDWGAGIAGRESASGLLSGLGTAGNPIYTTPTREHAARADARVKEIQERIGELKPDAKQSMKDRLNDELGFAQQDQARAHDQEAMGGTGSSGGSGQGKTQSQAEQFGSGLLSGAMSDLGFGNVLGGKSPLDWPLVKMFTGLASAGLGAGNAWAANQMAGGGGIPGLNSGGVGSSESVSGLGGISSGLGGEPSSADSALAGGPGGGGGGDPLSALATSPLLSISKFAGASGSNGPGGVSAGPGGGGIRTQNDYRLFQAGVLDANGNLIPHGPVTGSVGDVLNGKGRGQFPTGAAGPGDSFVPNLLMPGHDFGPGLLGGPGSSPGTPQKGPTPSGRAGPATGPSQTLFPHFATGGFVGGQSGPYAPNIKWGPGMDRNGVHGSSGDNMDNAHQGYHHPPLRSDDGKSWVPWDSARQTGFGTDTVPAWLSPGEFVVNASATKKFGPQLKSMNAQHFASGGNVSLTPSSVSSVPMASSHSGGTSYSGGHHIVNDNRIIVQGNHMTDADQLAGPMQERQNAAVYQRSQFGGLPMAVGPGGG